MWRRFVNVLVDFITSLVPVVDKCWCNTSSITTFCIDKIRGKILWPTWHLSLKLFLKSAVGLDKSPSPGRATLPLAGTPAQSRSLSRSYRILQESLSVIRRSVIFKVKFSHLTKYLDCHLKSVMLKTLKKLSKLYFEKLNFPQIYFFSQSKLSHGVLINVNQHLVLISTMKSQII